MTSPSAGSTSDLDVYRAKRKSFAKCCFIGCGRTQRKYPHLHFFRFPVNRPCVLEQWLINCNNDDLIPLTNKALYGRKVCEEHFTLDCFTNNMRKYLKKNAVPTLHDEPLAVPDSQSSFMSVSETMTSGQEINATNISETRQVNHQGEVVVNLGESSSTHSSSLHCQSSQEIPTMPLFKRLKSRKDRTPTHRKKILTPMENMLLTKLRIFQKSEKFKKRAKQLNMRKTITKDELVAALKDYLPPAVSNFVSMQLNHVTSPNKPWTEDERRIASMSNKSPSVDSELASQLDLNSMTSSMKRARKSASATEVEVNEGERAVDTEAGPCASTSSMQPAAPEVTAQDDLEFGSFERQMSNVLAFSIPTVEETPAPSHEVDITLGKETQTCTITLADIIETTTDDAFTASSVKVKPIDTLQAKDTSGVEGESKDKEGVQTSNIDINAKTLESAIQRLESVSNKLTAASLVDSYDQFGKYISSVLRGLPIKKVNSLKQKIISEVMEAVAHEESGLPKNVQHTQANVAPRVRSDLRFVKGQSPVSTLPQEPKSYRRKCKCNPIAGNMPLVYPSIFTPTPPLMVRQVPIVASSMGSAASMNAPPSFEGFTSRNPPPYLDKADLKNVDDSVMAATAPKHTLPAAFGNDQSLSQSPRGRKRRKTAAHPTRNAPSPCETSTPSATTSGDESSRDDQPPDTKEGSHLGGSVQLPDNSRGSRREGVSNVNVDQVLKTDEQDFEMDIEEGNELARIKEDQYLFETVLCGENSGLYIKEEALDPEEPPPPPTNPLTPATCHTCHLCNAKCNSREDLRIHFASAHPGCDAAPCSTSDAAGGGYFNT